ncbi:MAG TPA: Tex-like N-terminal domain-containing protein [Pirellulales bacterium]|nr:Tex-like N-terminal domain-containing protein [Pirellulales bacterium]
MSSPAAIELAQVAGSLGLQNDRVAAVVTLLDEGNTVPFITRYRKDQTGGLDEEQIRDIQQRVLRLRLLAERKQTILRSIESQGKLTPALAAAIEAADTTKRLEDLYLPYKPKKQTLATTARTRGLEPLALEILSADPACANLDARAADFVNTDKHVATAADALLGAGHILAEMFAERADVRGKLRAILERSGKIATSVIEPEVKKSPAPEAAAPEPTLAEPQAAEPMAEPVSPEAAATAVVESNGEALATPAEREDLVAEAASPAAEASDSAASTDLHAAPTEPAAPTDLPAVAAQPAPAATATRQQKAKEKAKDKKKEKELSLQRAFRDYFQYSEAVGKIPPHRVLAINRGERARVLRVRIDCDLEAMQQAVDEASVPPGHPHADFLRGCGRDALARLVLPSLEREIRRELTDHAETHAVEVFARNLRNLLLQPPVRDKRLLAIDPGYKSGCKLVALDEFGNLLDHAVIHLIGKEERRTEAKAKVVEFVKNHNLSVIVIGNGTACRETERFVSDLIAGELAETGVAYVIVNEAGASVYSTSPLGRAEFPHYDATLRGAISIGRRLQDPLSELVKIDAANIGVGMYQHDVKAKHLRDSLDAVVESCVNFVGVDLNTASPALLRYVSGMNQLTAQRVYDHRTAQGPFKSREQLKEVSGVGEGTFVQSAGFLKIVGGDNPLDATWIHPESYSATEQILSRLGASAADLMDKERAAALAQRTAELNVDALAAELQLGALTLRDIVAQLARPGRDPRESLPPPVFKKGILKIDDLAPGMELAGTVLNVVDFGAFVDIGLRDSGLVHISQLADKYVQDPHEVVSVGDIVNVWVLEVDKQRRRVSLTMIDPAKRRAPPPRRGKPSETSAAEGAAQQGRPPRSAQQRPAQQRPSQQRPPHAQSRQGNKPHFVKSQQPPPRPKPHSKPKPVVPISKEMREGKAPLRTFGDLKQFWQITHEPPAPPPPPPAGPASHDEEPPKAT